MLNIQLFQYIKLIFDNYKITRYLQLVITKYFADIYNLKTIYLEIKTILNVIFCCYCYFKSILHLDPLCFHCKYAIL